MLITVRGIPAPQGSKRHVGGGRMIEQSKAVGPWREAIRSETQHVMERLAYDPFDSPVHVVIQFSLPRPKSTPKRVNWPAKRPDLDKLARAVLDGLTDGGAWLDDGQVVKMGLVKHYATEGNPPGCLIRIESIAP
jgi:crossover junction endodeoxyribonuclease RusA